MSTTTLLRFQPEAMSPAQLAAVSYPARFSGHTHTLYAYQLRRWFDWCETNGLDPLVGIQRAHVELCIRHLGESGLMPSSVNTSMHAVRGLFRFAHIDGLIPSDPASPRDLALPDVETLNRLVEGVDAAGDHDTYGDTVTVLATTALRISEVAGLRVGDIDLAHGLIHVVRQTYPGRGGLVTKQTKGRRRRIIPIIAPLRPTLERLTVGRRSDERLIVGPRGGVITTATTSRCHRLGRPRPRPRTPRTGPPRAAAHGADMDGGRRHRPAHAPARRWSHGSSRDRPLPAPRHAGPVGHRRRILGLVVPNWSRDARRGTASGALINGRQKGS